MKVRWYIDPETGEPHVLRHGVSLTEVAEAIDRVLEDRAGKKGARVMIGRSDGGRIIRVVYVPDDDPESIFVITAFQLAPKALKALRRRMKRRR